MGRRLSSISRPTSLRPTDPVGPIDVSDAGVLEIRCNDRIECSMVVDRNGVTTTIARTTRNAPPWAQLSPDAKVVVLPHLGANETRTELIDVETGQRIELLGASFFGGHGGFQSARWVGEWCIIPTDRGLALWKPGMSEPKYVRLGDGDMFVSAWAVGPAG